MCLVSHRSSSAEIRLETTATYRCQSVRRGLAHVDTHVTAAPLDVDCVRNNNNIIILIANIIKIVLLGENRLR